MYPRHYHYHRHMCARPISNIITSVSTYTIVDRYESRGTPWAIRGIPAIPVDSRGLVRTFDIAHGKPRVTVEHPTGYRMNPIGSCAFAQDPIDVSQNVVRNCMPRLPHVDLHTVAPPKSQTAFEKHGVHNQTTTPMDYYGGP